MILKIYTDGAARGNPGEAAAAAVIYDQEDKLLEQHSRYLGKATNNVAEYQALILGLKRAQEMGAAQVEIFADSQLVVKQMQGQYRVKHPGLKPLFIQAQRLAGAFDKITFNFIPREKNKAADALANQTLDMKKKQSSVVGHQSTDD